MFLEARELSISLYSIAFLRAIVSSSLLSMLDPCSAARKQICQLASPPRMSASEPSFAL